MSTQRTPPTTTKTLQAGQSLSESDIISTVASEGHDGNITVRNKRQRIDDSPSCEINQFTQSFTDFKREIMQMLTSWKTENDNRLTNWKSEHDAILSRLSKDLSHLKTQISEIRESHLQLEHSMEFVNSCYEDIKNKVVVLESHAKESDNCISQLDQHIQDLQLQSRPATLEFRNLPQKTKETTEDLLAMVSAVGKVVNVEIQASSLRDLYRLPGMSGNPRPVVAEFASVPNRNEFLWNVRRYNKERPVSDKLNSHSIGTSGEKKPIYVDEHLPPSKKKLFYDVRQYAKANNFSCWHSFGRILLRKDPKDPNEKPKHIKSTKCLSALIKKQ